MKTNPLSPSTGADFDTGTLDLTEIKRMGVLGLNRPDDDFRWIAPRNLAAQTVGPHATYEVVIRADVGRMQSRIVRANSDGEVDLVLCVKAEPQ